jgi:hypothetical protein
MRFSQPFTVHLTAPILRLVSQAWQTHSFFFQEAFVNPHITQTIVFGIAFRHAWRRVVLLLHGRQ